MSKKRYSFRERRKANGWSSFVSTKHIRYMYKRGVMWRGRVLPGEIGKIYGIRWIELPDAD